MSNSRTINTLRNAVSGMIGQILIFITSFVYRTIFIYTLGQVYLGLQGLFTNILLLLSLAELGIASAISFSLYKPIADGNILKIKALINYFKRAYQIIAGTVTLLGLSLLPFLDFFINERPNVVESLEVIYLLYLTNSVMSYIYVYKQSLIHADQKGYIVTVYRNGFIILRDFVLIVWLLLVGTFIPTLIFQVIITLLINYFLSKKADKMYPYLKGKNAEKLDDETRKDITVKIKSMFLYKIGAFIVNGTDNILISKFVGLLWVGIYSNYIVLLGSVKILIQYLITALTPSVGNILALSDKKKIYSVYNTLYFIIFWIFSFFSISFLVLINPFISLWIGKDYLLSELTVIAIVFNFYLYGIHQHMLIYRNALGLYQYAKYKPIIEAIINLVVSIYLLNKFGLIGVIIGTTISYATTGLWIEPYVLYKYYLQSGLKDYWKKYLIYISVTFANSLFMYSISKLIFDGTITSFAMLLILCLIIPNCLIVFIFRKTPEYIDFINRINKLLKKIKFRIK